MFYLSPSVIPSYNDLEEMIKSADGVVLSDVPPTHQFFEPFNDERRTVCFKFNFFQKRKIASSLYNYFY